MRRLEHPGFFLRALLLDGDRQVSEGVNRFDHWAVRLECDPRSPRARMATLHEMYHGLLNDSTAYGAVLHVAALLARLAPDDDAVLDRLDALIGGALETHETYATYSAAFVASRGVVDRALIAPYAGYDRYLERALTMAGAMANPVIGFQMVQSMCRAAMQVGFIEQLAATAPDAWPAVLEQQDGPDARLGLLEDARVVDSARRVLDAWAPDDPLVAALLAARPGPDWDYDTIIDERFDPAIDAVGGRLYAHCRDALTARDQACLSFNGHQAHTAALLECVEGHLPASVGSGRLRAAAPGSQLEDLVSGFAQEQLVISPVPLPAVWHRLADIPLGAGRGILAGPPPHALIVVRPRRRLEAQYAPGPPSAGEDFVVAIRRRGPDESGRPTVEWFTIDTPETLDAWRGTLPTETRLICCVSMSALADARVLGTWLPALHDIGPVDVLIDLDPFRHLRLWHEQAAFTIRYTTIDLTDGESTHVVFALRPDVDGGQTFLAICSAAVAAALAHEIGDLTAAGGAFVPDQDIVLGRMEPLNLLLSHILREEPWFDFGVGGAT